MSNWSQQKLDRFKQVVLPKWAAIAEEHKFDVNMLTDEEKRLVLKIFREYWEANPPY